MPLGKIHSLLKSKSINNPEPSCDEQLMKYLLGFIVFLMLVSILLPLKEIFLKSMTDNQGTWIGLKNYLIFFSRTDLRVAFFNSASVAFITTCISLTLGFLYAYGLVRSVMPCKTLFQALAMLPLFAPTMMHGIALIYLLGNKGLLTTGFFGTFEAWTGFSPFSNFEIYGPTGIVIAEVIYTFPQAVLILTIALSRTDARLYDASKSLGATPLKIFFTVTLPGIKYGLLSAFFVCFTLTFTDFGAPKVVGGQFNVLAVDIYKQVVGQQNFNMGSTISILLMIPTILAFIADRIIKKISKASITSRAKPLDIKKSRFRDTVYLIYNSMIGSFILCIIGIVAYAAFVNIWPYDFSFSLRHFDFRNTGILGFKPYLNSLKVALLTALFGTGIAYMTAWLNERASGIYRLRHISHFFSLLPMALPGLVIGIAYIFFFNKRALSLIFFTIPNPFQLFYGTYAILIIANIVHFFSVSYLTCVTALQKVDMEFDRVASSLGISRFKNLFNVMIPLTFPAIVETAMYLFVNSMVTISAVIFLCTHDTKLASIAVVDMEDAGDTSAAAAMSFLLLLTNIIVRILYEIGVGYLKKRSRKENP